MRRRQPHGLTLLEVMLALFIFVVGIVGVLAAIPTGVRSAEQVILQDASIHLAHSKFAQFRRDRVDPLVDLISGSAYMTNKQEPLNSSGDCRDFKLGFDVDNFDDIQRYEWKVEVKPVKGKDAGIAAAPGHLAPSDTAGTAMMQLASVQVTVRQKGTDDEFTFTQYMFSYGN
ncbi:MAG TPA: prepilin-type N-terminal cleavage/methylation domain-containing protein [Planctomycetota bacterium]|nr:prepilin-type N-terminal cleavage/methylation domain-containing protein [Planctomycetota bacterium]